MHMDKANLHMQLEIYMMVIGLEIKLMVMVLIQVLVLGEIILGYGLMIYNMAKV